MSSSPVLLLLLLSFLVHPPPSHCRIAKPKKPLVFALRAQKVPSFKLARPPSKLRFHHNVSLTVSLAVGTPPQNVTMVLDTGSELSWLLCSSNPKNPLAFHPTTSSSFASVPCSSPTCRSQSRDLPVPPSCDTTTHACHVSLSYADASTSEGVLAADFFAVGEPTPPLRAAFGCMTNTFDSAAAGGGGGGGGPGLLGMNRGALSFVTQAKTRRFSYCISDRDDAGLLLLGHDDLPFLPLNYTPLYQPALPLPYFDRLAYSVQFLGIRVGGKPLSIPLASLSPDHTGAGQTMVDSGTQFSFLLGDAYNKLKNAFLQQTKAILTVLDEPDFAFQNAFDLCFRIPEGRPLPRLPAVTLVFKGAEMEVAGDRLLYRVPGERRAGDGVWCFTFGNADLVPITAYVIGHHHQMNVWVEYDLENGRVGLAPVRCDVASQRLGLLL